MKKVFVILFFITIGQTANAQLFSKERIRNNIDGLDQQFLSWGYFIGFNSLDF